MTKCKGQVLGSMNHKRNGNIKVSESKKSAAKSAARSSKKTRNTSIPVAYDSTKSNSQYSPMLNKNEKDVIDLNQIVTAPLNYGIILAALRCDAQGYYKPNTNDYKKYIIENKVSYFILANTWYILLKDYAGRPLPEFKTLLSTTGLLPLIKEAKDVTNAIIRDETLPQSFFSSLLHYNLSYGKTVQEALQVLRYPKRFSPYHTDALEAQCLSEFLARNNRAKMINRKELPYWLQSYLREIISVVLKDYNITVCTEFETFASFPTGVTAEGCTTFAEKFSVMERERPFYFGAIGAYRTPAAVPKNYSTCRYSKAVTVPKTADKRRVIAEEENNRQVDMFQPSRELDRCISSSKGKYGTAGRITLHDQTRNQRMALEGSVNGKYATIDCTAASDSVTVGRVRSVFPPEIVAQWDNLRSEYVCVNNTYHTLHLYATMGSRLTFPIETLLFWSIAVAATETVCRYTHTRFRADDISVYGDDVIVPTFACETVIEFLELCGFEVNREKSFSSGCYRESCGEEYYAGYNVSSHYYPRRQLPLDGKDNMDVATAVVQLCELQHKLYFSNECSALISEVVRLLYPQVTYSSVGERYSDLWSDYMPKSYGQRPYGCIQSEDKGIRGIAYRITSVPVPVPAKRYYVTDRSGKTTMRYYSDNPVEGRSVICCDTSLRDEYHTTALTKYSGNATLARDVDRLAYIRFLKEGPMYTDPLLQLLGISDKPIRESLGDRGHAKLVKLLY